MLLLLRIQMKLAGWLENSGQCPPTAMSPADAAAAQQPKGPTCTRRSSSSLRATSAAAAASLATCSTAAGFFAAAWHGVLHTHRQPNSEQPSFQVCKSCQRPAASLAPALPTPASPPLPWPLQSGGPPPPSPHLHGRNALQIGGCVAAAGAPSQAPQGSIRSTAHARS